MTRQSTVIASAKQTFLVLLFAQICRLQCFVGNEAIDEKEHEETDKVKLEAKSQNRPNEHIDKYETCCSAHFNCLIRLLLTTSNIKC